CCYKQAVPFNSSNYLCVHSDKMRKSRPMVCQRSCVASSEQRPNPCIVTNTQGNAWWEITQPVPFSMDPVEGHRRFLWRHRSDIGARQFANCSQRGLLANAIFGARLVGDW